MHNLFNLFDLGRNGGGVMTKLFIKAVLAKHGCKLSTIAEGDLSIYPDDKTVYFEDPQQSTRTIRFKQFSEALLLTKLEYSK